MGAIITPVKSAIRPAIIDPFGNEDVLASIDGLIALYDPYRQYNSVGAGQTLLDYSGRGNHAQLGSTAGVDASDPTFNSNRLTFGVTGYVNCGNIFSCPAGNGFTYITVFSIAATNQTYALMGRRLIGTGARSLLFVLNGKLYAEVSDNARAQDAIGSHDTSLSTSQYYVAILRKIGNSIDIFTNDIKKTIGTITGDITTFDQGFFIGKAVSTYFNGGNVPLGAVYNIGLPDTTCFRAVNYLKSLMASRGIMLAA